MLHVLKWMPKFVPHDTQLFDNENEFLKGTALLMPDMYKHGPLKTFVLQLPLLL